jgi:hypothetical protein
VRAHAWLKCFLDGCRHRLEDVKKSEAELAAQSAALEEAEAEIESGASRRNVNEEKV